ncbi:uncharacterized protein LOC134773250 [Penaeus indicus]|uniref:uncharacterized protein LOC134773250 n=1 Tax=Penaeus indicus TaxID=29960 RepID=UPI00300DB34B
MAKFSVADFVNNPSVSSLVDIRKDDWKAIAEYYQIPIKSSWPKLEIKENVVKALVDKEILEVDALTLLGLDIKESKSDITAIQLRKMEIEFEKYKLDLQVKEKERVRDFELKLAQMQSSAGIQHSVNANNFDVVKVTKFVPPFDEDDPQEFFLQFERVANTLNWPKEFWTLLIQTVLKGKGRSSYLSLSTAQQLDFDLVKSTVLKSYQLTAEYYRQKFRNNKKDINQTYLEYSHSSSKYFKRWLTASNINDYEQLSETILLEQFFRGIPLEVKSYLLEREVNSVDKAAHLAENFSLVNRKFQNHTRPTQPLSTDQGGKFRDVDKTLVSKCNVKNLKPYDGNAVRFKSCFYCKEAGHIVANCHKLKLKKEREKSVANVCSVPENLQNIGNADSDVTVDKGFDPYKFTGLISTVEGDEPVPVIILRDTASSQSIVLKSALPFLENVLTDKHVLMRGVGGIVRVPLCKLFLQSECLTCPVEVAVAESLPVPGIHLLLGNDIAGRIVVPNIIVSDRPLSFDPIQKEMTENPDLFPSCAVTRSKTNVMHPLQTENEDLESEESMKIDSLFDESLSLNELCNSHLVEMSKSNTKDQKDMSDVVNFNTVPITRVRLIEAQKSDPSLVTLFCKAGSTQDLEEDCRMYYIKNGILMRKFRSAADPCFEWFDVHQIIIPSCFRYKVMSMAHDFIGGHLGVKKTLEKILNYFFWPGINKDVKEYCKTCKVCQLAGKPNQKIPPAPLNPIPIASEPFYKVIIDCVGPLPKTKKGNKFLLTIMCSSTRYPEAIPLRNITTKNIVPALTKFFTTFGIPRIIQSDRGSNFTSNVFKDVMKILNVTQCNSTAYHPESQGALERFHQTLKCTLTKFCNEVDKEWDESVPFMLYAIRTAKNESLGYSPCELLFGYQIRGPLEILFESLVDENKTDNLSLYVEKMKERIHKVREFAVSNMEKAQGKMKDNFDRKAIKRKFSAGDEVLLFNPTRKYPLSVEFEGPYKVIDRVSDVNYVISTPGKRRDKKLVHINRLKKYINRNQEKVKTVMSTCKEAESSSNHDYKQYDSDFEHKTVEVELKNSDVLNNLCAKLTHLSLDQAQDVMSLVEEFPTLFSDVPGCTSLVKHDVKLLSGATPVKQAPYRMSPVKFEILSKEINFLLDNNIIEPSTSEWASPCLLVPKSDGSWRLCTDYRKVNALTVSDCFPLPRIDDIIDKVGSSKFISRIDLLKGYYQVPLTDNAKKISALITPTGLYQYRTMPFGMKGAPATFQRLITNILSGLDRVAAYLDDLIIFTDTWKDHIRVLNQLFQRLS